VLSADFLLQGKPPYTESNGKFACLVCRRQFGSEEKLIHHVNLSELHRDSLAKAREEGKITSTGQGIKEAKGVSKNALSAILGASSKLEQQIKDMKQQKEKLEARKAADAPPTGSSSLDALFAFEKKLGSGGGGPQGGYRDRAAERRATGSDDALPAVSMKRAREINDNVDWKCGKCKMINFARVITCNKCGADLDNDCEYMVNHLQEKRHQNIMKMVRASNPEMAALAETNNRAFTGDSGYGGGDRPGLGSGR